MQLIMLARSPPLFQRAKRARNAVTGINEVGIFPNGVLQSCNLDPKFRAIP